jgi:hypothetical protein
MTMIQMASKNHAPPQIQRAALAPQKFAPFNRGIKIGPKAKMVTIWIELNTFMVVCLVVPYTGKGLDHAHISKFLETFFFFMIFDSFILRDGRFSGLIIKLISIVMSGICFSYYFRQEFRLFHVLFCLFFRG